MTEHPLETTLCTALWRQFGAAIDMLENALLACPTSLWKERLWSVPPQSEFPPQFAEFWYIPRVAQRDEGEQADEKALPVEERVSGEREPIEHFFSSRR